MTDDAAHWKRMCDKAEAGWDKAMALAKSAVADLSAAQEEAKRLRAEVKHLEHLEVDVKVLTAEKADYRDLLAQARTALKSLESLHEQTMAVASASNTQKAVMISEALALILKYGGIDGAHHKQWLIDQILRALTGDGYNKWLSDYEVDENGDTYTWDEGIAP